MNYFVIFASMTLALTAFLNTVSAEDYVYNMTRDEIEDFRLSELCYTMHADFTIQALEEFCAMSYGGVNTSYGEAIK